MNRFAFLARFALAPLILSAILSARAAEQPELGTQIVLTPKMVTAVSAGSMDSLIDEQDAGKNPDLSSSTSPWNPGQLSKDKYPIEFVIDLGAEHHISNILFWDAQGRGNISVSAGSPENWREILKEDGVGMSKWKFHNDLDAPTRYLRVVKESNSGGFGEMLVYEYTPAQAKVALARRAERNRESEMLAKAEKERGNRPLTETGTLFGKLPLVDEIDPSLPAGARTFSEVPAGASKVQTVLGQRLRTIPNTLEEPSYFTYRLGEGKLLEPGKAYLMTVEIPDDVSRAFHIANRGGDLIRGIQLGKSLGDTIFGYTDTNPESLEIPNSGKLVTFQQLFWLSDRPAGLEMPRGDSGERTPVSVRGFYVIVGQWASNQTPLSEGAAVGKIRLFEVPDPAASYVQLNLPPEELPRRHLFVREEMGDSVINQSEPEKRAVTEMEKWYEYHFNTLNFLGMNTFAKDLLEFGNVQHWDAQNGSWYNLSRWPRVWENILPVATAHGLSVLPYYEYAGSTGSKGLGRKGEDLVQPLKGKGPYTHITWAERNRADVTDPAVLEEFKRILDLTIIQNKDRANFVGAWLRPRVSQLPISFSDTTRERFAADANGGQAVTREALKSDAGLLSKYYAWWNGKRRDFLVAIRDHLAANGIKDPSVLYMAYHAEPAPSLRKEGNKISLVTDDVATWEGVAGSGRKDYDRFAVMNESEVAKNHLYREALLAPVKSFGEWEWNHAAPRPDPANYKNVKGVYMTYPFNREYTVNDPEALELFRSGSGLVMIRHYTLNENTMDKLLGYFVTDVDRPGAYGMMAEALAVANGDPFMIGYTAGHIYSRPFPDAVRRFNANFLALPALPSERLANACNNPDVVVRKIDAGKHGIYLAVVNASIRSAADLVLQLPKAGNVTEAATNRPASSKGTTLNLSLEPYELRTLHIP